MRVTSRRLNLRVAEQFADERQSLAERKRLRCICVAQIVYADIVEASEPSIDARLSQANAVDGVLISAPHRGRRNDSWHQP